MRTLELILDGEAITQELAVGDDPEKALRRYEERRLPPTAREIGRRIARFPPVWALLFGLTLMPEQPPAWIAAALLFTLSLAAGANSTQVGDLHVYYNALPSTELTPEVARQYGITRSANRALVNISVRQGEPGADRAVTAKVTVSATNLAGQRVELRMREVREGDAIYYLGEARTSGQETLSFDLSVTPEGAERPIRTVFRQEFFGQ